MDVEVFNNELCLLFIFLCERLRVAVQTDGSIFNEYNEKVKITLNITDTEIKLLFRFQLNLMLKNLSKFENGKE